MGPSKSLVDQLPGPPTWNDGDANPKKHLELLRQTLKGNLKENPFFIIQHLTQWMDEMLVTLFNVAKAKSPLKKNHKSSDLTLCAVGGYGRKELFPFSDIDLLFISPGKPTAHDAGVIEFFLYRLWDLGLTSGHSIRTLDQCIEIAKSDVTVATALLDTRLLCGQEQLVSDLSTRMNREYFSKKSLENFVRAKMADLDSRHIKYGDSLFLLEPNIKNGLGGLRDLNTLEWVLKSRFKHEGVTALRMQGLLSKEQIESYEKAKAFLFRVRLFLHLQANRNHEVLDFEMQRAFAETYGYVGEGGVLPVEKFMREYYLNARLIERLLNQVFYQVMPERYMKGQSVFSFSRKKSLDYGLVLHRGLINPGKEDLFATAPISMMAAFRAVQTHQAMLSPACLDLIRKHLDRVDIAFRADQKINGLFRTIVKDIKRVYPALSAMHACGFLSAFFPEFSHLQCLVQHDLYHIYTVDAHLLFAVRELQNLSSNVGKEKSLKLAQTVLPQVKAIDILVLAVLFHDIGKGLGKGHSVRGADLMPEISRRLGLNAEESQLLKNLVLHHLLMAHITQRRDIRDDRQIADFAATLGSLEMLRCLFLLTICDMRAVGPQVFNDWKAALLNECYQRSLHCFESGKDSAARKEKALVDLWQQVEERLGASVSEASAKSLYAVIPARFLHAHSAEEISAYIAFISQQDTEKLKNKQAFVFGRSHAERGFFEIWIYAADRVGFFAQTCGVLSSFRLNILGVEASTWEDGRVFNVYRVVNVEEKPVVSESMLKEIESRLTSILQGKQTVASFLSVDGGAWVVKKKSPKKNPPRVMIDATVSEFLTMIEVFATDRIGLLYDIAQVFQRFHVDIQTALISTDVDQVADVFYVKDAMGNKIVDLSVHDQIRDALLEVIS